MAAAREIDSVGAEWSGTMEIVSAGIDPGSGFLRCSGAFRRARKCGRARAANSVLFADFFISRTIRQTACFIEAVGKVPGEDAAQQFGEKLSQPRRV